MKKTIKIILALPQFQSNSRTSPIVLLKQENPDSYRIPLILNDTTCFPFNCSPDGPVDVDEMLAGEIMSAAIREFGKRAAFALETKLQTLRLAYRPNVHTEAGLESEAFAYFFFTECFSEEWLDSVRGRFISRGEPIQMEHRTLLEISQDRRHFNKTIGKHPVKESDSRRNLSDDDLEALQRAFKFLARKEKEKRHYWGNGQKANLSSQW